MGHDGHSALMMRVKIQKKIQKQWLEELNFAASHRHDGLMGGFPRQSTYLVMQ